MSHLVRRSTLRSQKILKSQFSTKVGIAARAVIAALGAIFLVLASLGLFNPTISYLIGGLGAGFKISAIVWQAVISYQNKIERKNQGSIEQYNLHKAILNVEEEEVRSLIKPKANKIDFELAFRFACSKNQFGMADIILEKKPSSLNSESANNFTPLQLALEHDSHQIMGLSKDKTRQAFYLIEKGCDVNKHREGTLPPLFMAIKVFSLPIIKELCSRGANDSVFYGGHYLTAVDFAQSNYQCRERSPEINRFFEKREKAKLALSKWRTKIKKPKTEKSTTLKSTVL